VEVRIDDRGVAVAQIDEGLILERRTRVNRLLVPSRMRVARIPRLAGPRSVIARLVADDGGRRRAGFPGEAFFDDHDVVLLPVMRCVAIDHDHSEPNHGAHRGDPVRPT
jgi:hypothetical protein